MLVLKHLLDATTNIPAVEQDRYLLHGSKVSKILRPRPACAEGGPDGYSRLADRRQRCTVNHAPQDLSSVCFRPDTEPRRVHLIRQLAMQPRVFQQVIAKYGPGLPSDASLQAYLQLELGFTDEACPVFIRVLRHAVDIVGIDALRETADTAGQDAPQEATQMPQVASIPPPPTSPITPPSPPQNAALQEHHKWKLAEGIWAEITISGALGRAGFNKLKKYVDLLEVSDEEAAE